MSRLRYETITFPGGPAGWIGLGHSSESPIILIHGFAGDCLTWQFNLGSLASQARVIAIDLPGHGRSTREFTGGRIDDFANWLSCVLDALAAPTCHLVGHSMGGWIALVLAKKQPTRVLSATVLSCGGLSNCFDLSFLQRVSRLSSFEQALDCACALFGDNSLYIESIARGLLVSAENSHILDMIITDSFIPGLKETPSISWSDIKSPLQFIWGDSDVIIPPPSLDRLPPNPLLHRLKGVGHLPHLEAAKIVNSLILQFITAQSKSFHVAR
ncbi:Alpha/beta fold hydrolase [Azospirillaceae bacterium]